MTSIYLFAGCIQCTTPKLPRFLTGKSSKKSKRKAIKGAASGDTVDSDPSLAYPEPPTALTCGKPASACTSGRSLLTDSTSTDSLTTTSALTAVSMSSASTDSLPYFTPSTSPAHQPRPTTDTKAFLFHNNPDSTCPPKILFPTNADDGSDIEVLPAEHFFFQSDGAIGQDLQSCASYENDWGYFVDMTA